MSENPDPDSVTVADGAPASGIPEVLDRTPPAQAVETRESDGLQVHSSCGATGSADSSSGAIGELRDMLSQMQTRLSAVEEAVLAASRQVGFLPPQVRMLGSKVDGIVTSLAEPRLRSALLGVLGVHDLIEQVLRLQTEQPGGADNDHMKNYQVLRSQLRLILLSNGLEEIPTNGLFDPQLHRAVQTVPVGDPAAANKIVEVVRTGFRNELTVLRFAEVLVGRWTPPSSGQPDDGAGKQPPEE